jgi:ABC-type uncharacterized transport system fused permease/ATPase subunit
MRTMQAGAEQYGVSNDPAKPSLISMNQGKTIEVEDYIEFKDIPILAPNGEKLITNIDMKIVPG